MNIFLWVLQVVLAVLLVSSFLAMPSLVRKGAARNNVTAVLAACFGLVCGVGLVVPWWTGWASPVTPIAASLIVLSSLWDSMKSRMPTADTVYLALVVVMGVVIALGRFRSFGQWNDSFPAWAMVVSSTALLVLYLLGNPAGPTRTRWAQAATGLVGILGGSLIMLAD